MSHIVYGPSVDDWTQDCRRVGLCLIVHLGTLVDIHSSSSKTVSENSRRQRAQLPNNAAFPHLGELDPDWLDSRGKSRSEFYMAALSMHCKSDLLGSKLFYLRF